jgi:DNA repair exonuclease SbcCD ATPase subunit
MAGNINGINPALIQLMQRQAMQQQAAQQAMRLQIGARVAPVRTRTTIRSTNGKREIEVEENGKVSKLKDLPGGGIEGEVSEQVNGKQSTRTVEAKDLEELKKKDADLARLYERYQPRPATPDTIKRQIESLDRLLERIKADLPNNPGAQRSLDSLQRTRQQYEERLKEAEKAAGRSLPASTEPAVSRAAGP